MYSDNQDDSQLLGKLTRLAASNHNWLWPCIADLSAHEHAERGDNLVPVSAFRFRLSFPILLSVYSCPTGCCEWMDVTCSVLRI